MVVGRRMQRAWQHSRVALVSWQDNGMELRTPSRYLDHTAEASTDPFWAAQTRERQVLRRVRWQFVAGELDVKKVGGHPIRFASTQNPGGKMKETFTV